jgi:hypothetical protein
MHSLRYERLGVAILSKVCGGSSACIVAGSHRGSSARAGEISI